MLEELNDKFVLMRALIMYEILEIDYISYNFRH